MIRQQKAGMDVGANSLTGGQRLKETYSDDCDATAAVTQPRTTAAYSAAAIQWRRLGRSCEWRGHAAAPERIQAISSDGRSPDLPHAEDRDASSNREAINASGALNRPRRSSGGMTASTASSFSEGSMRR